MGNITEGSAAAQKRQKELVEEISHENSAGNPLVEHLQRQVANAFILYLNYKHYHWQTYGPLFRDLYLLFDEFANAVLTTVDDFAECVRMIGQDPISHPEEIMKLANVQIAERTQTLRQMIQEADRNLLVVIKKYVALCASQMNRTIPEPSTCFRGTCRFMRNMSVAT